MTGGAAGEGEASRLTDGLSDWRGRTLTRERALNKKADPDVVEEWKWRVVPVWSQNGIVCAGEAYKRTLTVTFAEGAALADRQSLFNVSLEDDHRRGVNLREATPLTRMNSRRSFSLRLLGTDLWINSSMQRFRAVSRPDGSVRNSVCGP